MTETSPYISPERPNFKLRIRPLKAYKHFRSLIDDKEDTTQVFHIIEALNGRSLLNDMERFGATKRGQDLIRERKRLPEILDDHDRWKVLPENTVGRAYLHFMTSQGLSAQGLVDEYDRFESDFGGYNDILEWYANRRRDTHDLFHVLTGYSRDALGEACVLGFSDGQNRDRGVRFIAYMAGREVGKQSPKGAPAIRAVREAQRNGKKAERLIYEDIITLMAEPLEQARKRLNIAPPTLYREVHKMMKDNGIDPFGVIGSGEGSENLVMA